jgi:hypothetical protein
MSCLTCFVKSGEGIGVWLETKKSGIEMTEPGKLNDRVRLLPFSQLHILSTVFKIHTATHPLFSPQLIHLTTYSYNADFAALHLKEQEDRF